MKESEPDQGRPGPTPPGARNEALRCVRRVWNGCAVVQATGEVDWSTAPILREALAMAAVGEPPMVVVDLTEVSFLDSSGLSVLIHAHRKARKQGGWLRLAGLRPTIRKILRMTDADRVIPIHETLEAALTDIRRGRPGMTRPMPLNSVYGLTHWLWPGESEQIGLN